MTKYPVEIHWEFILLRFFYLLNVHTHAFASLSHPSSISWSLWFFYNSVSLLFPFPPSTLTLLLVHSIPFIQLISIVELTFLLLKKCGLPWKLLRPLSLLLSLALSLPCVCRYRLGFWNIFLHFRWPSLKTKSMCKKFSWKHKLINDFRKSFILFICSQSLWLCNRNNTTINEANKWGMARSRRHRPASLYRFATERNFAFCYKIFYSNNICYQMLHVASFCPNSAVKCMQLNGKLQTFYRRISTKMKYIFIYHIIVLGPYVNRK